MAKWNKLFCLAIFSKSSTVKLQLIILVQILMFSIICSEKTSAQACCSGGTPLSSNLGIQSVKNNSLQLQLSYNDNRQGTLIHSSTVLKGNNRLRNTHSIILRTSYGISKKISVTGLFSLIRQEEIVKTLLGGENFQMAQGVGDIVLMMQYQAVEKNDQYFILAGGLKMPTGATDRLDNELGIPLNPDLQPGTGSWDYLFGINYSANHILKPNLTFLAVSTLRLTTAAERFNGLQIYEFGDEFQILSGFKDSYFIKKWIFNPSVMLRYRNTQIDKTNNIETPNTGGHWLHLVPEIDFDISSAFGFGISGELPLYRKLKGTQLTTSYIFKLTLDYKFSGSK